MATERQMFQAKIILDMSKKDLQSALIGMIQLADRLLDKTSDREIMNIIDEFTKGDSV